MKVETGKVGDIEFELTTIRAPGNWAASVRLRTTGAWSDPVAVDAPH